MDTRWEHQKYEQEIYKRWEESGSFVPSSTKASAGKAYTIIMPPPNANDPLHVGHAMFVTVEDILIRYHRMLGDETLWLPGTDHAGIETQYVFEKRLKKEGKSRFSYDRETLYQMIWDYVKENSQVALSQMKRLGASADWTKTTFTLDGAVIDLVLHTFETMHKEGLIYRGLRLVNYCTKCGTAYSDLEMKYVEKNDPLYYLNYGPFTLATVRPETKFGDTAVAVNPKDIRYQKWIGQEIEVEGLLGKFKVRVVADELVDQEFGTGVVKVTPAHDPNDFEMGQRHKLAIKQVIGFDGKLNELTGPYVGLKVIEAREKVAHDLKGKGWLIKVDEKYIHNVGVCYRCGTVIEPLPLPQFFIKVRHLTEPVLEALKDNRVKVYGAGHDKILSNWLTNLQDWNISRQIVWGIRVPVWYQVNSQQWTANSEIQIGFIDKNKKFIKGKIGNLIEKYTFEAIEKGLQTLSAPPEAEYIVSRDKPGENYLQETDTFDTWFSSSQWPVVALLAQRGGKRQEARSKNNTKLPYLNNYFERYYPTSVMETGYDILPFWVMRMLMMGNYLTGKMPFKDVYLHGLVRDEKGQKMSKSKGNVINPLLLVDQYGADALRMALVMSTTPGHDSAIGEQKVKGMRNLSNKIWNAARFIQMKQEETSYKTQDTNKVQISNNKEYQKRLNQVVTKVTRQLNGLKIGLAAETVHNEFWHWYCDQVLEQVKGGQLPYLAAVEGIRVFLKLLHPFMPYVSEVGWRELFPDEEMLITQGWPKS